MTVSSTTNRKSFAGDGVTTSFGTSPVVFFNSSELVVQVVVTATGAATTLVEGTNYTVTGGNGAVGTVNLAGGTSPNGAPSALQTLLIRRVLPLTQTDDFVNNAINDAEVTERQLDKLTMMVQQLDEEVGRSLKVATSEGEQTDMTVAGKAGYYVRRNAGGTAFELAVGDLNNSTFTQSGTGAVERSVTAKLGEFVSVKDFGATGDGTTDDTAEIQAVIDSLTVGGVLYFPRGTYLITTRLDVADDDKIILRGEGRYSVIKKGANIDMISLGAESTMQDLYLDGEGGTYTGRGVIITTGANNNTSWRKLLNCDIVDMASHCVEWTAAAAGFKSLVLGGRYLTTNDTAAAFKLPSESATVGNRTFVGVDTGDAPFANLGQSQNTGIIGCQGGVPDFSGQPIKTRIVGCRIAGASSITFDGTDLVVEGNVFGQSSVTFASGLSRCRIANNGFATATITDNAGGATSANYIEYGPVNYTPSWTASSAPAIDNGTLSGIYQREGYRMKVNILFIAGSGTTFGTGAWSFSLPKAASRSEVGSAYAADTGTGFYSGICRVVSAASTVQTFFGDNKGNSTTATIPFAWASTDRMELNLDYAISG